MSGVNQYPFLSKSPIQLAVFEIFFDCSTLFVSGNHNNYHGLIKHIYNEVNHTINRELDLGNVQPGSKHVKIIKEEINQYNYTYNDKSRILGIFKDRFNLTINSNYSGWEKTIEEFKFLWFSLLNVIGPGMKETHRISSRFINRIEISNMKSPTDHFNTTMYANPGVIQGEISSFLMKYDTFLEIEGIHSNVTQGFEAPIGIISPYVFDIDIICMKTTSFDDLWKKFETIRDIKDRTFFSNLTETTLAQVL